MADLKRCPCGQIPEGFQTDGSDSTKYTMAYPLCCQSWHFQFRSDYKTGDEWAKRAAEAWNNMPRAEPSPPQSVQKCVCMLKPRGTLTPICAKAYTDTFDMGWCDNTVEDGSLCCHDRACHGAGGGGG